MSQKIRQGNDIDIRWSLLDGDKQPYDLTGKDIAVELNVGTKKVRIKEFDVSGNTLHFIYYGKDQKYLGSYALKYIENGDKPEMITFDTKDAFALVEHSWLAVDEGETPETIQLEVVTVSSELDMKTGPRGYSAYEIAVQEGFVGTEEEWLESLKGPEGEQGIEGPQGEKGDKGDRGEQGPQGDPGSDAEVTRQNIERALGYVPASPDAVPFKTGDGNNSVVQKGGNSAAWGESSVALGKSVTTAEEHAITPESTDAEIIEAWEAAGDEKFALAKGDGASVDGTNCLALGKNAHASGNGCIAYDNSSHAEGTGCEAGGKYSHAEGLETIAEGKQSHSEGKSTHATESSSHAEGQSTIANKSATHAEGINTIAGTGDRPDADSDTTSGKYSHSEGNGTQASGNSSHSEGKHTLASGDNSHAEGNNTEASGSASHAEGYYTLASGDNSHAEGNNTEAGGIDSHAEGYRTLASGNNSHAEGRETKAYGNNSHAEGYNSQASGIASHAEGRSQAHKNYSHSEGDSTDCHGECGHTEGAATSVAGNYAHAEGDGGSSGEIAIVSINGNVFTLSSVDGLTTNSVLKYDEFYYRICSINTSENTVTVDKPIVVSTWDTGTREKYSVAFGIASHVEGRHGIALGTNSHVEGNENIAIGNNSHAEGGANIAKGDYSHAEGLGTVAQGPVSHAEGSSTTASGNSAHAEGGGTTASAERSHAEGSNTLSSGNAAHSEGTHVVASGDSAHAEGVREQWTHVETRTFTDSIKSASTESKLYQTLNFATAEERYSVGMKLITLNGNDVSDQDITITDVYSGSSKWFELSDKLGIGNKATASVEFEYEEEVTEWPNIGARGEGSHIEGVGTETHNKGEHAEGRYNFSNSSTIHSIGIGTAHDKRKNAFEVTDDGRVFIYGVGGYDGTNSDAHGVLSLQEIINGIVTINDNA